MDTTLAQTAINLALASKWEEAKKINLEILKKTPDDIDSLNRLAHAASELGEIEEARKALLSVLEIDPLNPIAIKKMDKINKLKTGDKGNPVSATAESFLEEPGKTKLVSLLHLGGAKVIAKLDAGDEVNLSPSAHRLSVTDAEGKYIGRLSDDLAARLRNFIKIGNKYQVLVKSVDEHEVKIFIRELERAKSAKDAPTFPMEKLDYVSFTPPELVHKEPVVREEIETSLEE